MSYKNNLKFKQNFIGASKCMLTVIYALFLRETYTLYGHDKLGYIWVLLRSVFGIGIFVAIRMLSGIQFEQGMHIIHFLLIGFLFYYIFSESVSKCIDAISANSALLSFPHVIPLDIMISRCILVFFTNTQSALVIILLAYMFGITLTINNYSQLFFCIGAITLLGFAFGVLLASLNVFYPLVGKIWSFLNRTLFFASGVFFSIDRIPAAYQEMLRWNPLLQLIQGAREAMSNALYFEPTINCPYICLFVLSCLCFGLLIEQASHRRLEQ